MQITRWIQTAVAPGRWRAAGRANAVPETSGSGPSLPAGTLLDGRYEIDAEIGRGRSGVVYRGTDLKMDRPIAVRAFPSVRSGGELTTLLDQRLRQEARAVASIRHPNVVTVHDFGSDAELAIDFLVMELLDGGNLPSLIGQHGTPNIPAVIRVLSQASAGVAAGHREGVVHRTLSPASLFLEAGDGAIRVRVLDFGLADLASNQTNSVEMGRAEYRSPEQLHGARWVSPASDVFSLGGIGHFMLRGTPVWGADSDGAIPEMERMRRALLDDRRFPIGLREVLVRALASHPEDRFPDARALLIALDEIERVEVIQSVTAVPEAAQEAAAVPSPEPAIADGRPPERSNSQFYDLAGTGAVVTGAAAVCFLASFASYFSLLAGALGILAAIQLLGEAGSREPLRSTLLGLAGFSLLGLMLARALQGSVPDLLFAQIAISAILPRFSAHRPRAMRRPEISSLAPEVVARDDCPNAA